MKRFRITFTSLILLGLLLSIVPAVSAEPAAPTVYLDGKRIVFETPPYIADGTTLVPMKQIFEELGAAVTWDEASLYVTAVKGNTTIGYQLGLTSARKNWGTLNLDVPGEMMNGSPMMPLRFAAEAFGATVGWEAVTRTITISTSTRRVATVSKVLNGDTLEVYPLGEALPTGEVLRLIGVDTPERYHPTRGTQEQGNAAFEFTKKELEGSRVFIEVDVKASEPYGQLLGYVYTQDGAMFNAKLLAEGYGRYAAFPSDFRWGKLFQSIEAYANEGARGIWNGIEPPPRAVGISPVKIDSVDRAKEIVTLVNYGLTDVNMKGWKLVSVIGNETYTFPDNLTLYSGKIVRIVSGPQASTGIGNLVWTTDEIWSKDYSAAAELYDSNGVLVCRFE